jgi:hypothetical protein
MKGPLPCGWADKTETLCDAPSCIEAGRKRGPETRGYRLARGLSNAEALRRALRLDKAAGFGDHRGFKYFPATGRAYIT